MTGVYTRQRTPGTGRRCSTETSGRTSLTSAASAPWVTGVAATGNRIPGSRILTGELLPPGLGLPIGVKAVTLLAKAETREIVPAHFATESSRPHEQQQTNARADVVVRFGPGTQIEPAASRAPRVDDVVPSPKPLYEPMMAVTAPEGFKAEPPDPAFPPLPRVCLAQMAAFAERAGSRHTIASAYFFLLVKSTTTWDWKCQAGWRSHSGHAPRGRVHPVLPPLPL